MIIYLGECAPSHMRGTVSLLLSTGNFAVQLLIQPLIWPKVLGNERWWWLIPTLSLLLCIIHLSIASFFPQSPKHLYLNKHNRREAERSLRFYHGEEVDVCKIFASYDKECELTGTIEHMSLIEVWRNKLTR
jgi:hypothetical protein